MEGATISVLDTLIVELQVSDEVGVQNVLVELITASGQVALGGRSFPLCTTSTTLTFGFILDNIHLESGTYFLRVTAFDATNQNAEFIELNVLEVPLALHSICWLGTGGNVLKWTGASLDPPLELSLPQNYHDLQADSWNRRIVAHSEDGLDLVFVDLEEASVIQTASILAAPNGPVAGHWDPHSRRYFHAVSGDQFRVYSTTGQAISAFPFPGEVAIAGLTTTANHLILAGSLSSTDALFFLQKNSGALFNTVTLSAAPTVVFSGNERVCAVLNNGEFRVFDVDGNGVFDGTINSLTPPITQASPENPERTRWLLTDSSGNVALFNLITYDESSINAPSACLRAVADFSSANQPRYFQSSSDFSWSSAAGNPTSFYTETAPVSLRVLLNK
jgi:hypothetical protein